MVSKVSTIVSSMNSIAIAFEIGYKRCQIDNGNLPTYISMREAGRRFGSGVIRRWIEEGTISISKDGDRNSKCRVSLYECLVAAATDNRCEYFQNKTNNQ